MTDTNPGNPPIPESAAPAAATAPVAPVTAHAAAAPRSSNGTFFVGLLAVVAIALSGFNLYQQNFARRDTVQGFYVLDLQKLVTAKMIQVLDTPGVNPQEEAKKMTDELTRMLQDYGNNGFLVLKRDMVMSVAADQDITEAVAAKMGLDLKRNAREVAAKMYDQLPKQQNAPVGQSPGTPAGANGVATMPAVPTAASPGVPRSGAASSNDPLAGMPPEARDLFSQPKSPAP